jgi:hypothetical protein
MLLGQILTVTMNTAAALSWLLGWMSHLTSSCLPKDWATYAGMRDRRTFRANIFW